MKSSASTSNYSSLNSGGVKNGANKENNASVGANIWNKTSTCSQSVGGRKRVLGDTALHTEQRAAKRQQFDQVLKNKEKMQEQAKKDREMQKAIDNENERQKLRSQMTFKAWPYKPRQPMEIRSSDKPLTDPRSPQLLHHRQSYKASQASARMESIGGDPSQDLAENFE